MVELDIDEPEVMVRLRRDRGDAPHPRGDEERFGRKVRLHVAKGGAAAVLDDEFADDRNRVLVECEVDVRRGRALDSDVANGRRRDSGVRDVQRYRHCHVETNLL